MIYEEVFRQLQQTKVKYLVVGGMAVNFYGILRATADLDLMIHLEDGKNVQKFIKTIKNLGFQPRVPVPIDDFIDPKKRKTWLKEKGALVMTFVRPDSFEQIDVFLQDPIKFSGAYKRRKIIKLADIKISLPSLTDLKKLKKIAGREKDISDIKQIEKLEELDNGTT